MSRLYNIRKGQIKTENYLKQKLLTTFSVSQGFNFQSNNSFFHKETLIRCKFWYWPKYSYKNPRCCFIGQALKQYRPIWTLKNGSGNSKLRSSWIRNIHLLRLYQVKKIIKKNFGKKLVMAVDEKHF